MREKQTRRAEGGKEYIIGGGTGMKFVEFYLESGTFLEQTFDVRVWEKDELTFGHFIMDRCLPNCSLLN